MSLHEILVILRARWRIATYVFAGFVVVVVALSLIWPRQYMAVASVVIDNKSDPLANGGGNSAMAGPQAANSYVNTQADIISSQRVAQRVVKLLNLDQTPQARKRWAHGKDDDISVQIADYLVEKKLVVAPAHDSPTHASDVIDISVTWSDPKTAAALANAFAQVAIETNIDLKVAPAKQYAVWFDQRSRALHAALEEKQKRLSDFQTANGIVATDEKMDVENSRLTELSTELVTLQGLRQESQSRQRQVGADIESLPEVLQSPVIASLKASLALADAKRQDIATRLGKNHPDYQEVEGEITNLRARIAKESASIAASLGSTAQVNVRRENDLRAALDAQKKRVLELKHQHDEASVLEGDVTSAQKELEEVTERLAQSSLQSLTQQTNVVQLTVATPPIEPSTPKMLINLLLAIFFGAAFGIGAAFAVELSDRRVREEEDLRVLLGVPVLAKIGALSSRSGKVGRLPRPGTNRLEPAV